MNNVNDIIDMLKDRLVEATRKTVRVKADVYGDDEPYYTFGDLYEAMALEEQLNSILFAITGKNLSWSEDDQAFVENED